VKILDKKTPGLMLDAMFAAFKNRPCIGKAVALN
jgi:hypothetical protein